VNVTPVNDAPVSTDDSVTTPEDTPKVLALTDFEFTDPLDTPANSLQSVIISTLPVDGILKFNGVAVTVGQAITAANIGQLVYTPDANENGTNYASFTFKVVDDGGTANGGQDTDLVANTIMINITPVNDAPIDENESDQTKKNVALSISAANGLLKNATDPERDTLTITGFSILGIVGIQQVGTPVDIPGVGAITINADGSYVFTPAKDYIGLVPVITYTVSDGQGGVDTSILTITINPDENLPPLPRKDVFGHHYFQRRFEEKPIEMGRYEFNEIVLDFNGDQGGINQFRPPMTDTTGTRDALDYSNVTPYNKFDRVADEIEIAKRSLDLGLAILKLPDYELRNILPLADVKVPANGNVEYRLPAATFKGGKGDLKLVAVLKDGSPLPGWLKFNPKTGLFEGVVPPDHVGPIDLKVIATDDVGGQADVKLTIKPEASKAVLKGKPSFTAQLKSAIGLGK
jgi:hypothetical protein